MDEFIGLIGFIAALILIILRVPVAVAMGAVGIIGTIPLMGWDTTHYILSTAPFEAVFPYSLSVIPLFVLMGVFAAHAGLSRNLYTGVNAFIGHFRGGLAMATVGACAAFGAICGSSLATVATMSKVAMPEMRKHGYPDSLAAASVAAGGTLGVLIPPSIIMVIYALLTEQSVGALFSAALLPSLLAISLYLLAVVAQQYFLSEESSTPALSWAARKQALLKIWDVVLLFSVVMGGIYTGFFSPTEAAAVGALGAFLFTWLRGKLTWQVFKLCVQETADITGMLFLILIGAALFNFFIESSNLPTTLLTWLQSQGFTPLTVMICIVVFYLILGCFMDSLSMILLTVPFIFPVVTSMGYDPIWFGILLVTVVELGLITPPIGMNLFIIQGVIPDLSLRTVMRGIIPFIFADGVRIILLIAFPSIALWLPTAMKMM